MKVEDRLEEAKSFLSDLSKDLCELFTMAQITIPMVEGTIEKAKLRISQVERLFGSVEEKR